MRKLVTIKKIDDIKKHPDADNLDLVFIGGWQIVSKSNVFIKNDLCVMFEIDSFIPVDKEPFTFLEKQAITWQGKRGARIKTIKLRGQLSQGLVLPLKEFPLFADLSPDLMPNEDDDLSEDFGVVKWEVEIPAQLAGKVKGGFPSFIPKTDQERVQNLWGYIKNPMAGKSDWTNPETGEVFKAKPKYNINVFDQYEISIKLDGSSMTAYYKDGQFGICSRNLELKDEDSELKNEDWKHIQNSFWKAAKKHELEDKLTEFGFNIALQGELVGPGIQGNNENLNEIEFRVYDVYLIDEQSYSEPEYRYKLCETLNIPHVPVIEKEGTVHEFNTIDEIIEYANGPSMNPNSKREGLVFKNLNNPNFSFKVISNEYLLEHGDR